MTILSVILILSAQNNYFRTYTTEQLIRDVREDVK